MDQIKKIVKKTRSVDEGKRKPKNVYDLPGQKHVSPEEVYFLNL